MREQSPDLKDMIDDFIMGLALAVFGGTLAIMGLPTVRRWRLPSLPVQPTSRPRRWLRVLASIVALGAGLPIALAGLAMVGATLAGYQIVLNI